MPLGILEDHKLEHVPGTAYVHDDATRRTEGVEGLDPGLKYDTSGPVPIILVPQPSDDPNDPLNLPLWRRDLILGVLALTSVVATSLSPILAADTLVLSRFYKRPFTDVALLTGWHLLGVGIAAFFFIPSSRVWGKRHAFLIGNIFLIFSSAWAGTSGHNFKSMIAARLFQGIGLAPFEALVNAAVGDLYFVHERGKRMALTNFAVFGGSFMTPVIVGKMTSAIGWPWTFKCVAIFSGFMLPFVFFFVPEVAYHRSDYLNTDTIITTIESHAHSTPGPTHPKKEADGDEQGKESVPGTPTENGNHDTKTIPEKVSYWSTLMPFNGRKTDESYWKLLLRPFPLFLHPSILWACLIQGTLIGWTVFIGIILAVVMMSPPLFFDEVKTGYLYIGAFLGALLGFIISGLVSDWGAKLLTRRNKGVYEPEFRLILVIPQLIFGCTGLYGFGITAGNIAKYKWFWPAFFFGSEVAGMVIGAVASGLYIVDAHRNISIEAFTCMTVFKNVFSFGLTWSGYHWLIHSTVRRMFIGVASVQVLICLLTIPLYIFGKRNRSFFARHDILKMLGLW